MIIFINGSINSGKSTVSALLAQQLKDVALLEIDVLREMIEWMPIDKSIPINLKNAVSVIRNFVQQGIDVIVPYPLSERNYQYFMDNLSEFHDTIRIFTLSPQLDTALINRGARELTEWEVERIKHHYSIGIHKPAFGEIIDNTNQTPEETASAIVHMLDRT